MGREVRRVPPNWEHPKDGQGYKPMIDKSFAQAAREWKEQFEKWESGWRPTYFDAKEHPEDIQFWEYEGEPPDREYYRPEWPEGTATWFQLYETVSEGTPVTPPFATEEELIEHLVNFGDDWSIRRARDLWGQSDPRWSRASAEQVVRAGWAPSMIVVNDGKSAKIYMPDQQGDMPKKDG